MSSATLTRTTSQRNLANSSFTSPLRQPAFKPACTPDYKLDRCLLIRLSEDQSACQQTYPPADRSTHPPADPPTRSPVYRQYTHTLTSMFINFEGMGFCPQEILYLGFVRRSFVRGLIVHRSDLKSDLFPRRFLFLTFQLSYNAVMLACSIYLFKNCTRTLHMQ